MALKVTVKVSSITNLSDARYCAGMGVQMLGFVTVPGRAAYIEPNAFQEMRGWFAGPQVVAEIYGIGLGSELEKILEDYRPDLLEGGIEEMSLMQSAGLPYLLLLTSDNFVALEKIFSSNYPPSYLVMEQPVNQDMLTKALMYCSVLVKWYEGADACLNIPVSGFVLSGGAEERPGYKDYEHLSGILEKLDDGL